VFPLLSNLNKKLNSSTTAYSKALRDLSSHL